MPRDWDLVVVGDGLAGRVAALAAAERGAAVHIVADAEDAARHGSGLIDVLGYLPGDEAPVASPLDAVSSLPASHPYSRLDAATIRAALGFLDRNLDVPYVGLDEPGNAVVPGPLGNPLVAYGYPCSVADGVVSREDDVLLVDVAPLSGFDATMAANRLREANPPMVVDAASIDLTHVLERGADRQWVAARLDREVTSEPADRELAPAFRDSLGSVVGDHDRIGIPASLGVDHWPEIHRRVDSILGADVFEIPTGPPSVLGMRLDRAIDDAVAASPVHRTRGVRAVTHRDAGDEIEAVGIDRDGVTEWVSGRQFVLATGGLIGGGLEAGEERIEEPLLGCPVDEADEETWTAAAPFDAQPFASSGLAVDDGLRPLASSGSPHRANLRAAGDVLGHFDPVQEGSGAGVAIATGYAAGRMATGEVES